MVSRTWLPVGVAAGILVASLVPGGGGGATIGPVGADKLLHVAGYALLAATALFALQTRTVRTALAVVVAVTAFGGVVELLQAPIPGRHLSGLDLLADAIGALAGTAAWWLFDRSDDGSARQRSD